MGKPKLKLFGTDGNAFAILGAALKQGRRAGWDEEKVKRFKEEAMRGDYYQLLDACVRHFEVY